MARSDDLKGECLVLPVVRVANGVYFVDKTLGTSRVAEEVCVIRRAASVVDDDNFAFSDVEMVDAEDDGEAVHVCECMHSMSNVFGAVGHPAELTWVHVPSARPHGPWQ